MYASLNVLKAFGVTIQRFLESYVDDFKWFLKGGFGYRYKSAEALKERQSPRGRGLFVVQYPKERLPQPERFRGFPFLIEERCTACGTCARACPPQCIWITRATDENGKSLRRPESFYIDIGMCMNCGFCAEFCPFDAIKMGHEYEIASFEGGKDLVWGLEKLTRPVSYHAEIHPAAYAEEEAKKAEKA
ncbi:MAG: NADH-quinone oxidoreductase subunit I [Anaerolineae bacterium]|nr:NADH-quinone oxidoreductase subunit I [Anaerolineae bacterium]